jgi:hypothetical protein
MAVNLVSSTPLINFGSQYGTSTMHLIIRNAIAQGVLAFQEIVIANGQRLDTIAGKYYGDGRYWRIIAAASGIGFIQVPPNTVLRIPDLKDVLNLIS